MKNKLFFLGSLVAGLMCVQPAQAAIKPTDVPKICAPLFEEDAPQQIIKNSGSFCQKISFYADVLDKNDKEVSKVFVNGYAYSENNATDSFYWPTTFRFDTKYTKKTPYKVKVLPTFNCSTDECFLSQNKTITLSEGLSAPFKLDLKLLVPKGDDNKQFYNSFKTYIVPEHQSLNIDTAFYFESERAPTIACNNTDKVGCHYADAKFSYGDRYYQTVEAAQQAKIVIDLMNGIKPIFMNSIQSPKKPIVEKPKVGLANPDKFSSVTVIVHEDKKVTVGISGIDSKGYQDVVKNIQKALNEVTQAEQEFLDKKGNSEEAYNYTISTQTLTIKEYPDLKQGKEEPFFNKDGIEKVYDSNVPGKCSEAWAVKGASKTSNKIIGYATAWRNDVKPNPHPMDKPPNKIVNHMKPCNTCIIDTNLEIYAKVANEQQ